jgi:periplasmic divalent cation tolerance protein
MVMSHLNQNEKCKNIIQNLRIMTDYIQIQTTTGTKEEAEKIGRGLIEEKLAACFQIMGPVTSIFNWQGKMDESQEWLCLIKTRKDLFDEVKSYIETNHSYETPEIIATEIIDGSDKYLNWMSGNIKN